MAAGRDYLFKFGNYVFPMTAIVEDGYVCKPNQRIDLDPYTDQTGVLRRGALPHTKTEVNITTRKNLSWEEVEDILANLKANYISYIEKDANCTYFDMENHTYKTGHFYLQSTQEFGIHHFNKQYQSITFSFVEY